MSVDAQPPLSTAATESSRRREGDVGPEWAKMSAGRGRTIKERIDGRSPEYLYVRSTSGGRKPPAGQGRFGITQGRVAIYDSANP
jgi:hypothetical protein